MSDNKDDTAITEMQKEQMLKLITKNFYRELINYGIDKKDIITASSHLLDYLLKDLKDTTLRKGDEYYNKFFTISNVQDEWKPRRRFAIKDVSISALNSEQYPKVAVWLEDPAIRYNFIPPFPGSEHKLKDYFEGSNRHYFTIYYNQEPVGIIGADNIDQESKKLEMRKLVGNSDLRGKGIGKLATFLFLYYAFITLNVDKVYIHSGDTNIRNIILNSKFGFELEGIFFDDVLIQSKRKDVVRMGLLRARWLEIFSSAAGKTFQ